MLNKFLQFLLGNQTFKSFGDMTDCLFRFDQILEAHIMKISILIPSDKLLKYSNIISLRNYLIKYQETFGIY